MIRIVGIICGAATAFVLAAFLITILGSSPRPPLVYLGNLIDRSVTPFVYEMNEEGLEKLPRSLQSAKTTSVVASTANNFSEAISGAELTSFILEFGSEQSAIYALTKLRDTYKDPSNAPFGSLLIAEADGFNLYKLWVNGHCIEPPLISYLWQHERFVFIVAGHDSNKVERVTLSILGKLFKTNPKKIVTVEVVSTGLGHECGDWLRSGEISCRSTRQRCL